MILWLGLSVLALTFTVTVGAGNGLDSVTLVRDRKPCVKSPTTASGSAIQRGRRFCSGELIFEDNFDFLDFEVWEHENTLAGGGVRNWFHRVFAWTSTLMGVCLCFAELGIPVVHQQSIQLVRRGWHLVSAANVDGPRVRPRVLDLGHGRSAGQSTG